MGVGVSDPWTPGFRSGQVPGEDRGDGLASDGYRPVTPHTATWHGEPTPPSQAQRAVPGTIIGGRYTLRAAIGHGGMGTVWQAADSLLRRDVAVKEVLLPAGMAAADRTAMYERTLREARAAAALSHPSVVQVYDVVTEGGRPPFDRGDPFETMRAIVEDPPVRPVRAGALAPVLYGLLEKDPARRWDVTRARQVLRELLAGPLANNAAHHVTDPYAVVPPAPAPVPQLTAAPTGQIGGRAMLAPGQPPPDRPPPALEAAAPAHAAPDGLLARFRRLPVRLRVGAVAGLALVVLVATIAAASMFSGSPASKAAPARSAAPSGPPFPVQPFIDGTRRFGPDVPAGWTQVTGGSYYDFIDPGDHGRTLRVNRERAGGTADDFIRAVAREQARSSSKCAAPFTEIAERDVQLANRPAAELEYTCGDGATLQHALWRATVLDGWAYEFRLMVTDSRFAESRVIYDHAVESYHLNKPS